MIRPKEYLSYFTDKELYQAFEELEILNKTGILPDGVVRTFQNQLIEKFGDDWSINWVEKEITYEISRRWFINTKL